MSKCKKCGQYCSYQYTYCKKCYYELGEPFGKATEMMHECKGCGLPITGSYAYCLPCAEKKGFIKNKK